MKIALVQNDDFSMWHFFSGLIGALAAGGQRVFAVTPPGPYVGSIRELGTTHVPVDMARFMNPVGDARLCLALYRIFRRERIDLVCNITIKPNVYGAVAARLARVPRVVSMVEGLGYGFADARGPKDRLLREVVTGLYRLGCALSDRVGFANPDDRALFVQSGIVAHTKALAFRSMIGVNLKRYTRAAVSGEAVARLHAELELDPATRTVMMVTRVVWSKGVREFVEASETAARWPRPARFVLVGPLDPGARDAVPEAYLRERTSPQFRWLAGLRTDVRELLALADVVTLPSYYREGVPVILLEALAMEKPIVTTDHVGCRETVDAGVNGFLVPARDSTALAAAIRTLIEDDALRATFGRRSRIKAETEFDEATVVAAVLSRLFGLSARRHVDGGTARETGGL